jgi:hypothetical protein
MEDLPEITEEQQSKIVDAGMSLMHALHAAYGADKASRLYQKFDEELGSATGLAFLRMLCGDDLTITILWNGPMRNKINCIKALREASMEPYTQSIGGGPFDSGYATKSGS